MTEAVSIQLDERVRGAAIQVLGEHGWDGLTLERVAEASGRARSTLWRQGLGREALVEALLGALADDFRSTMYPVLTVRGSGRDRFARGLGALCEVIQRPPRCSWPLTRPSTRRPPVGPRRTSPRSSTFSAR